MPPDPPSARPGPTPEKLPVRTVVTYALPVVGVGYLTFLFTIYFFKFSTDVLLIAPAAMGTILLVARLWDAVSDPMAGYLSDRTRSRLGRRRPWLLGSVALLSVVPLAVWSPPVALEGVALVVWMALALLAMETAATAFLVPHSALGAELTLDHHDRTRVFGYRHVGYYAGFVLAMAAMWLLIETEDKRGTAFWLALGGGVGAGALILWSGLRLRERPEHQDRGGRAIFPAFADVWRNPHARLLLLMFTIESLGSSTLGTLGPFFMQYVLGDESLFPWLLLAHFAPVLLLAPVAIRLSRRFGKKRLWALSIAISGASFGALFFGERGMFLYICLCGAGAGIGTAIGSIVGPSVQADVIDYDELVTGERKEGIYYATWNFARKTAYGITGFLTGVALQWVGFEPNAEQTESTRFAIRALFGLAPGGAYAVALLLFLWRFRLDETEHRRIRTALDARHAASQEPAPGV